MAIDEATRNKRLWADTGTDSTILLETSTDDDLGIDDIYSQALDRYPNDNAKQDAFARVLVFRRLLAPTAMQGRYVQNQSEEDMRNVFGNLQALLKYWEGEVAVAADPPAESDAGAFFFGVARGRRGQ